MSKTLEYYYVNGKHIKFDKYVINTTGHVTNIKNNTPLRHRKNKEGYNVCSVADNCGKSRDIIIGRAIASTFHGPPPTQKHTADHVDRNPNNDTVGNIRWATKKEQRDNLQSLGMELSPKCCCLLFSITESFNINK